TLDVLAAHGVGGTVGALLTGLLAEKAWSGAADGALFGNPRQLAVQAVAVAATAIYSLGASVLLLKLVGAFAPLRASRDEEGLGLDVTQHGEEAYARGEGAILVLPAAEGGAEGASAPALVPEGSPA
ncbi:MAG TPA: ammonia channel protein, partial [Thermoanaerobaculia bacterium]|nr:ammonia channel protein [Thermoanaerobaculia bacterium]